MKLFWQTSADELKEKEHEEVLRKRISLQRLPSAINQIIDRTVDPIQLLLANPALQKDRRASFISACSKTITQYKFDLMALNLDIIHNIRRGHQQTLIAVREKLLQLCAMPFIEVIEQRRKAMETRHEVYLQHKISTFFDQAPVTSNE